MSIRIKLILSGLLFLLIPLMGYQFIKDMGQLVQKGQEQALLLEAKAIASILHEQQELFSKETGILLSGQSDNNLYAQLRNKPIKIDGALDDWEDILQSAIFYGKNHQILGAPPKSDQDISFWHLLAYDDKYIYALFQVSDEKVDFRKKDSLSLNQSDHLRIYIANDKKDTHHYILNAFKAGPMSAYRVKKDWLTALTGKHDTQFLAQFARTKTGYNIELRIPFELMDESRNIAFAIVDFDPKTTKIIGTIDPQKAPKLNRLLLRSPQIENILSGLDKPNGRIWIVDSYQRVRAVVGTLKSQEKTAEAPNNWSSILFAPFLSKPIYDFEDHPKDIDILTNSSIIDALKNKPNNFVRQSIDRKATILGASVPIESGSKIVGAVIVEQTNNDMLSLENDALINVLNQILVIFLLATLTMTLFAIRLTYRINRLHRETTAATIESGKIKTSAHITVQSKDELGKLAKSISTMLSSLEQHTIYLERMPRTLRHEILNPLSAISTSLDNLARVTTSSEKEIKYLNSAQNGVHRLAAILHSLTEATSLESALVSEDKITFNLTELLKEYIENYQELHPNRRFELDINYERIYIFGWPESIAQMLDKILDNALDFGLENRPIKISLKRKEINYIYISNEGAHIPTEIQENIFESMVSKRSDKDNQKPHLGIGLYVARVIAEAHQATITVCNTTQPNGVKFTICMPSDLGLQIEQKSF